MAAKGYIKLLEESGELTQVVAKLLAYWGHDDHPDGQKLVPRIEAEIADLLAAIDITLELNSRTDDPSIPASQVLDVDKIMRRRKRKLATFRKWANEPVMPFPGTPLPPPAPGTAKTTKKKRKKDKT